MRNCGKITLGTVDRVSFLGDFIAIRRLPPNRLDPFLSQNHQDQRYCIAMSVAAIYPL